MKKAILMIVCLFFFSTLGTIELDASVETPCSVYDHQELVVATPCIAPESSATY